MEIFTKDTYKEFLKKNLNEKSSPLFFRVSSELETEAEICMNGPLYSVTFSQSRAISGNPHDFYTEAPYWWPDPKNPGGPFIRKDGEIYPGRFDKHRADMSSMVKDVYILSLAGFIFDRTEYIERAKKLIRVWFLDEETKMNPHLEYAQAIFGRTTGRGIGIIDTCILILLMSAMDYFTLSSGTEETVCGLKEWIRQYLLWIDTSKNGIEEREYFNNHGNWWNSQAAAYAAFIGNSEMLNRCFDRLASKIIPEQTGTDGSFTDELTRTKSFSYSLYNLEACAVTAEIAHNKGVDLWNKECADGKSIKKSLEFMLPYYQNPILWERQQISFDNVLNNSFFQLAGVRVDKKYLAAAKLRNSGARFFSSPGHIGASCMHEGFFSN